MRLEGEKKNPFVVPDQAGIGCNNVLIGACCADQ